MKKKLMILIDGIIGEIVKISIRLKMKKIPFGISHDINVSPSIIISLTSYGRRVKSTLYYTLVSLLRQTYKPNQIILWLDKEEWNCDNLPSQIVELQKKGLEIKYCNNIRSYKKLIPTLLENPYSNVITVDDDIYYPPTLVQDFINAHKENPHCILSNTGHKIHFSKNDELQSYNEWEFGVSKVGETVFPTGVGGIFYPSCCLYQDVTNIELFMTLAPTADDVWFFFMAYLNETKAQKSFSTKRPIPIDLFYQKFHKGSSLRDRNCGMSYNDTQIKNIMGYYNISDKVLKSFYQSTM